MSTRRYALGTAAALLVALAFAGDAHAQNTPAQRAEQLNIAGKRMFVQKQYRAAAEKFYQATVLSPEGRLYWNLCLTRVQLNRLSAALTSCMAVEPNGAKDRVIVKSRKMIAELKAKGVKPTDKDINPDGSEKRAEPKPTGDPKTGDPKTGDPKTGDPKTGDPKTGDPKTGDPKTGDPKTGDPNATGFPGNPSGHDTRIEDPAPATTAKALRYDYSWSLAFELGTLFSSTVGGEETENYSDSGAAVRFHADFLLSKKRGLGAQGYLHVNSIKENIQTDRLQIFDAGGAVFKHFHARGNVHLTPLVGAHMAVMQPDSTTSGSVVFALGFRAALQAGVVFGRRGQYMFTTSLEYTRYLSAISESSSLDPMFYGLNQGSQTFAFALGFKMRFATPFGATSIFTLE